MANVAEQRLTEAEYLAFERSSETKHEFLDGRIFAMAGANERHLMICANLGQQLNNRLAGKECFAWGSDTRVKAEQTGLYTYPDVVVVCRGPLFEDEHRDTLLNPRIVFEVLSPSTEKYDRGHKAEHYRRVPSLTDYLFVAQDRAYVEHYRRADDGEWILREYADVDGSMELKSVEVAVPLLEVYANVEFGEPGPLREVVE